MLEPGEFTIADVARAAGVSVSTVSRILNGKQDVAPATRQHVQQVIAELGYAPHAQAQRLRAGKTRNIALIFPLKYPGNLPYNVLEMEFIAGAAVAAGERDFFFNLFTNAVTRQSLTSLYRSAHVDGLVLMQIHQSDWRVDLLRDSGHPFVMIGHADDNTGISYIDLDFESSVPVAFEHLVQLGHQHIGFIALPYALRQQGYGPAARAWQGYARALETNKIAPFYRESRYDSQEIFEATLGLLDDFPKLTAIVTTHELSALSILRALSARGRSVPDDFSLVALMTERIAELSVPQMTHIDFPSYRMGYEAVDMLIRTLEGNLLEPEQILVPPRLLIRNTTAPVKEHRMRS
jgi:DNA-binding LacI/PurR family transcriptional regulator